MPELEHIPSLIHTTIAMVNPVYLEQQKYPSPPTQPPSVTNLSGRVSGMTVTLSGNVNPQSPGASIAQITIDWGDGTSTPSSQYVHTYSSAGTYTLTITAQDSYGNIGRGSATVTIENGQSGYLTNGSIIQCSIKQAFGPIIFIASPDFHPLSWSITLSSNDSCVKQYFKPLTESATTNEIVFHVPPGTYTYYVSHSPSYWYPVFGGSCQVILPDRVTTETYSHIIRTYTPNQPSGIVDVGYNSNQIIKFSYQDRTDTGFCDNVEMENNIAIFEQWIEALNEWYNKG